MADGIDVDNPEFVRPDGSHVITDYEDFTGSGTHDHTDGEEAFGDASSVAAQGSRTYDLAQQLPYGKAPKGCTVRIRGFAPDAELMSLKVFGEKAPPTPPASSGPSSTPSSTTPTSSTSPSA